MSLHRWMYRIGVVVAAVVLLVGAFTAAHTQREHPRPLDLMGEDVGWFNARAYHRGIVRSEPPDRGPTDTERSAPGR